MDSAITSILWNTFLGLLSFFIFVILYFKYNYTYWNKYNIPVIPPEFPYGSLGNIFKPNESIGILLSKAYKKFKDEGAIHGGIYILKDAVYVPVDPILIKNILIKDFNSFMNRSMYHNERDDPLSVNLLTMNDQRWKNMRTKLTPTFTSGKMKQMFPTFVECSGKLVTKISEYEKFKEPVAIKETLACFTTDIIGNCAFGIECNSIERPDSDFRKYGKKIFNFTLPQAIKAIFSRNFPDIARFLGLATIPKDVSNFFLKIVAENMHYRKTYNIRRNDFFQLLLDLEDKVEDQNLKINSVAAQSFVFFNAGFETSSTTTTFVLYELASNPSIQNKLRNEIIAVLARYNGEICYEAIMDMEYLSKVIDETLRKHPPFSLLARKSTQDYHVDGTDVVIKKGSRVFISVLGIQHDPQYYPDPEVFDPERFSEENISKRPPCTFLPFGDGPRNCIGLRFGLLLVKIGVVILLKDFKLSLNHKTGTPQIDKRSFIHRFSNEIWMDFEKV